jgi:hypothetical protein
METVKNWIYAAQKYAKAIVAGVGSVLVAVTSLSDSFGVVLLPSEAQQAVVFALAVLTAFSTWAVPNGEPEAFDGEE